MIKQLTFIIVIIVAILAVVASIVGYRMVQQNRVKNLLELGNQYLKEEKYEEAIASYKQVLTIDSKEETARENIVVAAVDWSDDLAEAKEFKKAEELIADVYLIVPDKRLEKKKQEILELEKEEEKRQEALKKILVDMNELAEVCASGDENAVFEYMKSDKYKSLISQEYIELDKKYETDYGTLGGYAGGAGLYFGDYDGEDRSGNGAWYQSNEYDTFVVRGSWSGDMPNGKQEEIYQSNQNEGKTIIQGNVVNGLWDGEVTEHYTRDDVTFPIMFHNGKPEVIDTNEHGAVVSRIYGDNGVMESELVYGDPDRPYGIAGFE